MRILLAEDERSMSRGVSALLEKNNYSVDAVYDGQEVLAFLDSGSYDALILDIMMPKLDGLEVLRRLRQKGDPIPVLMLTAKSEVEDKVTGLTNDLIYLSRMEEQQPKLQLIDFPLSDVVEEMAQSFQSLAKSQEKEFSIHIQPMPSFHGDEKSIRQLLSTLRDNALKDSPAGGRLEMGLEKQGKTIVLTVSNPSAQPMEQDKLSHLFDRFYRTDQSRSSQTGGYGLGLSIARSVVLAHKGKIRAESPDGRTLTVMIHLPA